MQEGNDTDMPIGENSGSVMKTDDVINETACAGNDGIFQFEQNDISETDKDPDVNTEEEVSDNLCEKNEDVINKSDRINDSDGINESNIDDIYEFFYGGSDYENSNENDVIEISSDDKSVRVGGEIDVEM